MEITQIVTAVIVIGVVGIFVGIFLGIAGIVFRIDVDEREEAVLKALPGNNCGGCGYAGCSNLANAIVNGNAAANACPVGGETTAAKIAKIMGAEVGESVRMTAFVHCSGDCENANTDYEYTGVEDCRMMGFVPNGGPKSCNSGCLGYGTCMKECPFDAISMVNGKAVVDREKCKACGKCVAVCPKSLISLIPYQASYAVACSSKDKGPVTMKACKVGCIGCGICVRTCPQKAVTVKDFHAVIDQKKCIGCGVCAEKCPKKAIVRTKEQDEQKAAV